ncbi:MAG: methyl-accepting chemotaxis protein [Geminicoccaceae bacterium]
MFRIPLRYKISILMTSLAALAVLLTSFIGVQLSLTSSKSFVERHLGALAANRADSIQTYLEAIDEDIKVQARSVQTRKALSQFAAGYAEFGPEASNRLQQAYIADNPYPEGERDELVNANDGTNYSRIHSMYHSIFRELVVARGYFDVFLVSKDGDLVYSVYKQGDFATNVVDGPWAGTDLANAFRETMQGAPEETHFFDFKPYRANRDALAGFISTPILDVRGAKMGALIYQMPIDRFSAVVHKKSSSDPSTDFALVAPDGRNLLARADETGGQPENGPFDAEIVARALAGEVGAASSVVGETGMETGFASLEFIGNRFAVLAMEPSEIALAGVALIRERLIWVGFVLLTVLGIVSWIFGKTTANKLIDIADAMRGIQEGDLETPVRHVERVDEIGEMAQSVNVFRENALEIRRLRDAQVTLADEFENTVGGVIRTIEAAIANLEQQADDLSAQAGKAADGVGDVATASDQSTRKLNAVASAVEQFVSSINEISKQTVETSRIAGDANEIACRTEADAASLSERARKVGEIVAIIEEIAEQTNLLALNATIEAARAGDAGKGFAVVAAEVKSLSTQTASATEEIASQISGIQAATEATAGAIRRITGTIGEISSATTAVTAAVQEQTVSIEEITMNVNQVAHGSEEISANCSGLGQSTDATRRSAVLIRESTAAARRDSALLNEAVARFLANVRAA